MKVPEAQGEQSRSLVVDPFVEMYDPWKHIVQVKQTRRLEVGANLPGSQAEQERSADELPRFEIYVPAVHVR